MEHEMFAEQLLDPSARSDGSRLALTIRLNWYRALPLSAIEELAVTIDGDPIAPHRLTLRLGGAEYPVTDLSAQDDVWWFVLDSADLLVQGEAAGAHAVELAMTTRIPYFGPAPDASFTTITDRARATVTAP
jgi:hypothetical protein